MAEDSSTLKHCTREYFVDSRALLSQSVNILKNVENLPLEVRNIQQRMDAHAQEQSLAQENLAEEVGAISLNTGLIASLGQKALYITQQLGHQVAKTLIAVATLITNIKELVILLVETNFPPCTRQASDLPADLPCFRKKSCVKLQQIRESRT